MLKGLDTVNWQNLHHAYGAASDVPDLLRALASNDEEIRREAIFELYGTIWHQGTVYEASSYAVPFLIELLECESVQGKGDILGLLASLASGPLIKPSTRTYWHAFTARSMFRALSIKRSCSKNFTGYNRLTMLWLEPYSSICGC